MDAFDSDVVIFAAAGDELGRRLAELFPDAVTEPPAAIGSLLLLPEVLSKPQREQRAHDLDALTTLLAKLDLRPVDHGVASLATHVAAKYKLKAADAVHLATAIAAGAQRFITNNQRDFRKEIDEIEVVYPDDLVDD